MVKKIGYFLLFHMIPFVILAMIGWGLTLWSASVLGDLWEWFLLPAGWEIPSYRERVGFFLIVGLSATGIVSALATPSEESPYARAAGALAGQSVGIMMAWAGGAILNAYLAS